MEFVGQTRVLAVDDDEGSRKLMKAMLAPLGYQVTSASGGAEAVDLVSTGNFDVVLMDIAMPEMDGITALEIIREKYPMEDLPVVMVTGIDDAESRNHALEHRANDFIIKPVEQGELMARLGNILTLRRAKREVEERLGEAQAEQESIMKMMGAAVHDIRGAMTCARGFLELAIAEDNAGSPMPGNFLSKALTAVERAGGIAEEAGTVSAMGRGRLRVRIEEVEIGGLLSKRLAGFRGMAAAEKISLKLECSGKSLVGKIDRELAERFFGNLVSGAMRRAGNSGKVDVSVSCHGDGFLMVSVADSGEGASRPFRQRVYDKECEREFHDLGMDSSTGTGMAFCRMAIEAMGGKMLLNSEAGEGTRFSVILQAQNSASLANIPKRN